MKKRASENEKSPKGELKIIASPHTNLSSLQHSGLRRSSNRDTGEDETWGQSRENSSPFQLSNYRIQKLKRERLVASNNKIRDQSQGH